MLCGVICIENTQVCTATRRRYISGRSRTSRWAEMRGLTNFSHIYNNLFAPKLSGERQSDRRFRRRLQSRPKRQQYTPCLKKNMQNYFCYNHVKLPPNLIIFGIKMANSLKLYEEHSFSTSPNSYQCTAMLNADVPNCYITLPAWAHLHHQFDRRCHMI